MFLELREEKTENINRYLMGFPGGASGEEPACQCRRHKRLGFYPWIGKIPWRRKWQPTPVFLPGKFHGQRILAGAVHGVTKKLGMTQQLNNKKYVNKVDWFQHLFLPSSVLYCTKCVKLITFSDSLAVSMLDVIELWPIRYTL